MTTTNTPSVQQTPNPTLKAYEDKVRAQVQEAKARLDQFEARAKERKAETEITTINRLKTARQDIDRKLQGLASVPRPSTSVERSCRPIHVAGRFKSFPMPLTGSC